MFQPWPLVTVGLILLVGIALYWTQSSTRERLLSIGSFTQSVALVVGVGYAINFLPKLTGLDQLGPKLAYCLPLLLYGAVINLGLKLSVRFLGART